MESVVGEKKRKVFSGNFETVRYDPASGAGKVVYYRVRGIDVVRRCQAKNQDGHRCREHGVLIRTEMIDGQRCEFDACKRHEKAEFFTPHPSVVRAAKETKLALKRFPEEPPFDVEQALNGEFRPA